MFLSKVRVSDPPSGEDRDDEEGAARDRDLCDLSRLNVAEPQPHSEGDRNRAADGEDAPRGFREGVDADHREDGEDDHEHDEDDDHGHRSADASDFVACHLAEGAPASPHGEEEHEHVLDRPGDAHAEDDPQRSGKVPHLGGQDRADERAGAGDGGEMVAVEHHSVGGVEILAVVDSFRRGCVGVVGPHDLALNIERVKAVGDGVCAHRGYDEPYCVDLFAAHEGEHRPSERAHRGYRDPQCDFRERPRVVGFDAHRNAVFVSNDEFFFFSRVGRQVCGDRVVHEEIPSHSTPNLRDVAAFAVASLQA